MHNSRFKFFLIPEEELKVEATTLKESLQNIFNFFNENLLSDKETLFLLITLFCEKRRPRQWWMKGSFKPTEFKMLSEKKMPPNKNFSQFMSRFNLPTPILSLDDFLLYYRFKNLPEGVFACLYEWQYRKINLTISDKPLLALEMLTDQAGGKRVITMARKEFLLGQLVDKKRDAFEFLLHDLCHAHLYFSPTHTEQKLFFTKLLNKISDSQSFFSHFNDEIFREDLEYIMSDMNSSYPHLVETLRGKLVAALRRKNNDLSTEHETLIKRELSCFL